MKTSKPWQLVALLSATATAGYICRVNVSTAGALMMDEFNLSQVDMGRLFSSFLLGYALFQIPAGALADRFGTKRVLSIAVWLWVLLTVSQALIGWSNWEFSVTTVIIVFVLLRFLLGISASPTYPASALGVSQWVPAIFQGRANGFVIGSVGLGSAIAPPLVSGIMVNWGWQMALLVSALPALIIAIVWQRMKVPDKMVTGPSDKKAPSSSINKLKNKSFYLLSISYGLQGYVGYIFVSWFYLYLVQVRHFSLLSGAWMSSLPWVLSIVSIPLGGYISDKLIGTRLGVWGGRIVPMIGMGMSGILISIGAHTSSAIIAAITLAFATAFVLCVEGPFWAMMIRIAGGRSGTAGGIMNMGSNLGGLLSPMLTPWIAVYIGWEYALHIAAALAIISALLWLGISPANKSDQSQKSA
ncbi:MAG TPA: MFS transporter [Cyclobacteriaceae bacterium]|nr:MFS transporter [Cyclobacteriaceae bacterium]